MRPFEYFEPESIEEAVSLMKKYGEAAQVLAGGTDLLVRMQQDRIRPKYIINLATVPGLDYIRSENVDGLAIGAMTTIATLEKSEVLIRRYPILIQAIQQFGTIAIRNAATIGGNLCRANPSADMPPGLIGLSAQVTITGPDGQRTLPLEDFFTGPGSTALKPGELLIQIHLPPPSPRTRGVYYKYTLRSHDLTIIGVAVVATMNASADTCENIRIVLAGSAPTPMRAVTAEKILEGHPVSAERVEEAARAAAEEAQPREPSHRASPEYRRRLIRFFTQKAITEMLGNT